jgi:hypothetical protein
MKTKLLLLMLTGCLLALTAWLVHVPTSVQADEIPEKYRDTVRKGLEFLVKSQHKDGHWEGDDGKHPVAMTGLAGLALLLAGEARYEAHISKAADWLIDKGQPNRDGLIFSEHPSETSRYMQGHGLATLFLAGVSKQERDDARGKKLTDTLMRTVKYIVKAQSTQGGWYNTSKVEGHDFDTISATVIQIQALQAAENAGIPVPREAVNDAQDYLKAALAKKDEQAKAGQNRSRPADTAAALAARFNPDTIQINATVKPYAMADELCKKWLKYCQAEIPVGRDIKFGRDELTHYYFAQTMSNVGGETWTGYRTTMFDHLQSSQNKDGSWPAGDGISVGPVYSTALWCTILQLDKRNHPLIRPARSAIVT